MHILVSVNEGIIFILQICNLIFLLFDYTLGLRDRDYDTQAANAADICIDSISSLIRLFLWHGRRSYKRNVDICSFVLQRGLVISFIELIFVAVFYTISL